MSFYTSKGDDGTTSLLGEGRVAKYHARIEAVGTLDESSAALGLARAQCRDPHSNGILLEAQHDLYKLMAEVAATPENAEKFHSIDAARVTWLEIGKPTANTRRCAGSYSSTSRPSMTTFAPCAATQSAGPSVA